MNGMALLWVMVGGSLGSAARFLISRYYLLHQTETTKFPWPTLWSNLLACLILGALIFFDEEKKLSDTYKYTLAVGFCGGFSTFSTFSLELVQLIKKDDWAIAASYLAVSVLAGVLCIYLGKKIPTLF